ncbi:MAG: carboxypeptidase regulatory-like domain-containing protein [Planctomycetes bacterium]|nr:carboxypeptidase regulatory-like domain-containing protein [Planctomycetota bacterium]
MRPSQLLFACVLAIAAAAAAWWLWFRPELPAPVVDVGHRAAAQDDDPGAARDPGEAPQRTLATDGAVAAASQPRLLQVRLRGLHPDAPWTTGLTLTLQDRSRSGPTFDTYRVDAAVAADGACALTLPPWWQPGRSVKLSVTGSHPRYRDVHHREHGAPVLADELILDVQPLGDLTGTVRDAVGEPVPEVRISAFGMRDGRPFGEVLGHTSSGDDGSYRLRAPPDVPLLVVATPMLPRGSRWYSIDGVRDSGELDARRLPSARDATLDVLAARSAFDFVVDDAARVHGRVAHPDGTPRPQTRVHLTSTRAASPGAVSLSLGHHSTLTWLPDGSLAVSGDVPTDEQGRFELPAHPGEEVLLQVLQVPYVHIVGNLPIATATAPARADIELPFVTTARAVHRGQLMPHARLLTEGGRDEQFEKDGTRQLLVTGVARIRASHGSLRSGWVAIEPPPQPTTVDLQLADTLVEVAIELEAAAPVRNATFTWRRDDGLTGSEQLRRDDRGAPFRLFVEPGSYRLRISHGPGERNGTFVLPVERALVVGAEPRQLTVPVQLGGRFRCQALDENGQRLPGTCTVRGPDGKAHPAPFAAGGEPGVLLETATSTYQDVLPPGPYELVFDLGARGVHTRYVQIVAREVVPVVIRL